MLQIPGCSTLVIFGEMFIESLAVQSVPTWVVCIGRFRVARATREKSALFLSPQRS